MSLPRTTVCGARIIVVGDKTSHGGVVVSGSPLSFWGPSDIPIARKGDKVTCPKCKPHIFMIAEGTQQFIDTAGSMPVALEGHKTSCGAVLIASD